MASCRDRPTPAAVSAWTLQIAPYGFVVTDLNAPFTLVFLRHLELDRHMVLAPAISVWRRCDLAVRKQGAVETLSGEDELSRIWFLEFESEPGTNLAGAVILQRRVGKAMEPRRAPAYCWRMSSNVLTCYKCLIVKPKKKRRLARP
jgi:hypothetical protein